MNASRLHYLVNLWFTFRERVDRRTYFTHGVLLMLSKYVIDTTAVWLVTREVWTPANYLSPLLYDRMFVYGNAPVGFWWAMVFWTLPFLWVGVSMTMRRAVDAGYTPWLSLVFFLPFLNYMLMLALSFAPSVSGTTWYGEEPAPVLDDRLKSALLGIAAGLGIVLAMVGLSALALRSYGMTLFLGTPLMMGAATAFVHNYRHPRSRRATSQVVVLSVLLASGALLLFALEGIICLAMAAPIAVALAWLGGVLGRAIALRSASTPSHAALAVMVLPLVAPLDTRPAPPHLHEVISVVEVNAPPEVVWQYVVSFSELPPPSQWLFRTGVAYPQRARIEGTGVGAVRRCEFSTGAFIEPITVWDAPHRLGFDVLAQPAALQEWSPYRNLHPPHLDGYFRSRRGEFRLTELPGRRTRLEGSTWYELGLSPELYWKLYADAIVGGIHHRVLKHVKERSEEAYSAHRD